MVTNQVSTCLVEGTEHSLQGYENEPWAFVREEIRIVVVVGIRFVDEVEVSSELSPLFPLPFLLSYAEDILAGVKSFHRL